MKKVFLGGTCADSVWRKVFITMLEKPFFNPVVEDWNAEAQKQEIEARENCDFVLYVLTPKGKGLYSIAEVVDDSNKRPNKTLFCVLQRDGVDEFTDSEMYHLGQVSGMVQKNGAKIFRTLEEIARFLNKQ